MKKELLDLEDNECRGRTATGFCAKPVAKRGGSYCASCDKAMHRPTVKYADSALTADLFAGKKSGARAWGNSEGKPVAVDSFIRGRK